MSTHDAWAAGLFEGEGAVTVCRSRVRLSLKMVEETSVRRFAAVIGVGRVYGPYGPYEKNHLGVRPIFMWLAEEAEACIAAERMYEWLSDWRRARIDELMPVRGQIT